MFFLKNKFILNRYFVLLALWFLYAPAAFSIDSAFNPIPTITKVPSNPSVNWLSQVLASPAKYGIDEWVPDGSSLSDNSTLIAYSIDFTSSYPVDVNRLIASTPKLKVKWVKPRVRQSLSLRLWKEDVSGALKEESPWITPGRLTWTLVNFVYECTIPKRIYIIDLTTIDARTNKRLEYRLDNDMLTMDYTDSWTGVCEVGR